MYLSTHSRDTCSLASNHSLDTDMRGVAGTIDALDPRGTHNPVELAASAANTAEALAALGTTVRAHSGLTPEIAEWHSRLLGLR